MFKVELIDTAIEANVTQTPPWSTPTVEPELPHRSLPGGLISTPAIAASLTSDFVTLKSINKKWTSTTFIGRLLYFPKKKKKKKKNIIRP